jgi:alpha-D-ribose 1-methylphosphonate 5-triphosphate synthase subunit PhnG
MCSTADTREDNGPIAARREWMGLLARAEPAQLAALMPDPLPDHEVLRQPETGAVMVRGRTGATGAPFNLGEMTVTRCALRLASGEVGHALVQGRDRDHARNAALVDALMLSSSGETLRAQVLAPLEEAARVRAAARAAAAAETKVEFFTLVRGED